MRRFWVGFSSIMSSLRYLTALVAFHELLKKLSIASSLLAKRYATVANGPGHCDDTVK